MALPSLSEIRLGRCCCFDLRLGSLIIAGIHAIVYLILFIAALASFSSLSEKILPNATYSSNTAVTSFLVFMVLLLGMCVLLVRGIMTQTSSHMFPWICVNFTYLMTLAAGGIGSILYEIYLLSWGGILTSIISLIVLMGIQGYCFLVLFSVYCEIIEGSSGSIRGV